MTIIRKFDIEEQKRFPKKMTFMSIVLLAILSVMQIWANNTLATYGAKLEEISQLDQSLQMENQVLENKIATLSSLNNIASQSATLGLTTPKSVQYLH